MTESQLSRYIEENDIEWHFHEYDVLIFVSFASIYELHELFGSTMLTDMDIEVVMKDGYFAIWMNEICEYYDIEIENVFKEEPLIE